MDTTKICPRCRTPLPADAPGGLCPRCLMDMNLATETEVTGAGDLPKATPSPEELAAKFPQLEILSLLGRGGMGAVYKARQKELDRIVALKILPPSVGDDPAFAERFAREAKALAKLSHSNIVTLFEFGRADGLFYFLMEFVDGVNLRQLLQTGRVSPREALAIVPQICDALQYAHDQGIVHRDIKPENILMDRRGRVKVADFGLAKLINASSAESEQVQSSVSQPSYGSGGLTDPKKVMGTPQYMAPEQKESPLEVDHRADIYALGVVFYQMLTGELPGKRIEPPSKKVQVDVRLDQIVLRALEQTPERRYQSAEELKTGVETIVSSENAETQTSRSSRERQPLLWIAYACFLFGTVGQFLVRSLFGASDVETWRISAAALSVAAILGVFVWRHWLGKGIIVGSLLVVAVSTFDIARERARPASPVVPAVPESVAPAPSQSAVVSNATFGETIERTVNDDGAKEEFFVDLDTDRSFTMLVPEILRNQNAMLGWMRTNGVDVMGETGKSVRGLVGFELAARPIPSERWETISAVEVLADDIMKTDPANSVTTLTAKGELPETFLFKTRDGGKGVLQITGFSENPRGVRVRYKLVKNGGVGSATHTRPVIESGVVVERTLPDPDNFGGRNQDTLQLRTGELTLVAGAATPKDGGGRLRALAASQGDLFAEYDDFVSKKWALVGAGLKLSDLLARQWETATAADLDTALESPTALQHVEHGGVTLYMLPEEMLPLTLAFEARDGTRGVLQVTGFVDDPRSVKIRYRLINRPEGKQQSREESSNATQYDYRRMIQIDSVLVDAPKEVWSWLSPRSYNAEKLANDPGVKMLRGPRIDTEEGKEATLHLFSSAPDRGALPQHDVVRVRATLDGERIRHSVKGHFTKVDDTWISPANITDDAGFVHWGAPMIYGLPSADSDRTRFAVLTISPVLRPRSLDAEKENKPQGTRAIFGPVIEKAFDGQTNILLNVAQSRVLPIPPEADRDDVDRKFLSDEVDFLFAAGQVGDSPVLNWEMWTRLDTARLRDNSFEDVTTEEISHALASKLLPYLSFGHFLAGPVESSKTTRYATFSADDYPPRTFAFKTADNQIGVLEVVSFTTDIHPPQELVIRHKFLQRR